MRKRFLLIVSLVLASTALTSCSGTGAGVTPNSAPTISSLSPNSATAGGAAFTLTVNGTGFVSGSTVQWNGSSRVTTFVSATQLTAGITVADIAAAAAGT